MKLFIVYCLPGISLLMGVDVFYVSTTRVVTNVVNMTVVKPLYIPVTIDRVGFITMQKKFQDYCAHQPCQNTMQSLPKLCRIQ